MNLPNYQDGSILNLMSSIARSFHGKTKYNPLALLSKGDLESKNVVLIVFDGLGYEYLKKYGEGTVFNEYLRGKMTSLFPAGTAVVLPAFYTGDSCLIHGMTGWYEFIKELGVISVPLRYTGRVDDFQLNQAIEIDKIFNLRAFANKLKTNSYVINKSEYSRSDFSLLATGKAKIIDYDDMSGFFKGIKKAIKTNNKRKYVFAYLPDHDSLCHEFGTDSKKVLRNFKLMNKNLKKFLKSVPKDTTIIITADHGLTNVPNSKKINMRKHPKLTNTLTLPLCGESRLAYAYVKPHKSHEFENYMRTKLGKFCSIYKSHELVEKKFFGLEKPDKRFFDRIGDYTIIMKEGYAIKDYLISSSEEKSIGRHGGVSKEEMFVPLIVIKK